MEPFTSFLLLTASQTIIHAVPRVLGQVVANHGNKRNNRDFMEMIRGNSRLIELQANHQKQLAIIYHERNDIEMTRLEMEKAIALSDHEDRRELLELKAKELRLTERLAQQEQVFRAQESALYRELLRELKTQEIDVKLQEIQTQWDAIEKNWPSRLNRRDTEELLLKGRTEYPLLLLIAPPNISRSCPDSFQNNLPQELRNHLKAFIKTQYGNSTYPVELYADYFNRDIFDIDVKQLRHVLSPLPTVVIYCDITDREVYFHVGSWGWGNAEFAEVTSEPWNWRDEKNRLQKDEPDVDECLYQLRLEVIDMYKVLSSFLVDWYYLNSDRHYLPVLPAIKSDFPREDLVFQIELIEAVHQRNLACSAYDDGVQCLRLELFAQAVTHFQTALRLSADFSEAELYLGIALCGAERYAEAEQQLAAVLKQEPQNVFALNYYGLSLLHLKQLSAALTCFEQLVELNPDCADGWLHLSETLSALGRGKLATPYLDKAKKLPPCASPIVPVVSKVVPVVSKVVPVASKPVLIKDRYRDNGDGTVTDIKTNLQWMRCLVGQTWQDGRCHGEAQEMYCDTAVALKADFAGHSDWRLPTIEELRSLVYCSSGKPAYFPNNGKKCEGDYQRPTLVQEAFPDASEWFVWSCSPVAGGTSNAWGVGFNNGSDDNSPRYGSNNVRLVRGGQ
ncbi:DUF1566 domain-containing protein [Thioflexithrix psekupsensis]|uniref:Lcl C-terminal domain-containing protein n=1 Tax=Thioflexithrix psekupsensis TaxID=1570016 RepID=A0A251X9Z0_9GAMM|nr:DUF1566 domain-containing protein [Thioflexithrix psekupsensis]OUD15251.1 hypothetical protein TPSD3_01595 [Thioflexithrix psekupsensis]